MESRSPCSRAHRAQTAPLSREANCLPLLSSSLTSLISDTNGVHAVVPGTLFSGSRRPCPLGPLQIVVRYILALIVILLGSLAGAGAALAIESIKVPPDTQAIYLTP